MRDELKQNIEPKSCDRCEGKGYTEIRDCSGDIQRTETCSYCGGKGYRDEQIKES